MVARLGVGRLVGVVVAAMLVVGVVTGLVVTGTREPAAALRLLTGDAWLANDSQGSVTQVNGYARRAGATVRLPAVHPGDPFTVIQRPDGAYVLDRKTGALEKISSAGENVTATATAPGSPSNLQLLTGAGGTWVLDTSSGLLQPLNPTTLAPRGSPVHLPAPTGTAVMDAAGTIWVPVPHAGLVEEVAPGVRAPRAHPAGHPGDELSVSVTEGGAWAVDATTGVASDLAGSSVPIDFPPAQNPTVGSSPDSPDIVAVEAQNVEILDTANPSLSTVADPAANGVTQLAVTGTTAYLLNTATNSLITVDLATANAGPPVALPAGPNQLVSASGLVYVNNPDGPTALVVGPNGQTSPVTKYATNPGAQPTPVSAPDNVTSQASGNSGAAPLPDTGSSGGGTATAPATVPASEPAAGSGAGSAGNSGAGALPGLGGLGGPGGTEGPAAPAAPSLPITGPVSTPAIPVTPSTPVTPPASSPPSSPPPTNQTSVPGQPVVTASGANGALLLTWPAPNDNGSPITGYVVHAPNGTTQTVQALTATISGLPNGQQACATVQAVNSAGPGPVSSPACATPTPGTPGAPGTPSLSRSGTTITVSWTPAAVAAGASPIAAYVVTCAQTGQAQQVAASGPLAASFSGLTPGQTYSFTVYARSAAGVDGPQAQSAAVAIGSPPELNSSSLSVAAGPGQLEVSFSAATDTGGDPITYSLAVDGGGGVSSASPGTTYKLSASAGANHTVTLTATNAEGSARVSATGTSFATRTVDECLNTVEYNGVNYSGNYSYVNIDSPGCTNSPTPAAPGGVKFEVPATSSGLQGIVTAHDWFGNTGGYAGNQLIWNGGSVPGGWSESSVSFYVSTQAQPGTDVAVHEYTNGRDQYRYVPDGENPGNWEGSGWHETGRAFYVSGT